MYRKFILHNGKDPYIHSKETSDKSNIQTWWICSVDGKVCEGGSLVINGQFRKCVCVCAH